MRTILSLLLCLTLTTFTAPAYPADIDQAGHGQSFAARQINPYIKAECHISTALAAHSAVQCLRKAK